MGRTGAKNLGLFHQLGITLVILGMLQSIAPTCFCPSRSALRIQGRHRLALARLANLSATEALACSYEALPEEAGQDPESDQESHNTEELTENYTWSEALTLRRSVQQSASASSHASVQKPRSDAEKTCAALQRSRILPALSAASSSMTSRFCRFLC